METIDGFSSVGMNSSYLLSKPDQAGKRAILSDIEESLVLAWPNTVLYPVERTVPRFSQAGITSIIGADIQCVSMDQGYQLYKALKKQAVNICQIMETLSILLLQGIDWVIDAG